MKVIISIAVALLISLGAVSAQSLRDQAKRHGSVSNRLTFEFYPANLGKLISESELVVQGRVVSETPRFAADETIVVTYYEVAPIKILKQTTEPKIKPFDTTKILVRREGGIIFEGGNRIVTLVNVYPENEAPTVDEEVILFLRHSPQDTAFELVYGPYGCFRNVDGNVRAMTHDAAANRHDAPTTVAPFLAEVERLLHAKQ